MAATTAVGAHSVASPFGRANLSLVTAIVNQQLNIGVWPLVKVSGWVSPPRVSPLSEYRPCLTLADVTVPVPAAYTAASNSCPATHW